MSRYFAITSLETVDEDITCFRKFIANISRYIIIITIITAIFIGFRGMRIGELNTRKKLSTDL